MPFVQQYDKTIYKAGNQNWSLSVSPEGLIYAANTSGLLRFDGQQWKLYDNGNKAPLRSVNISPDGKIFTGGLGEFGFWIDKGFGQLEYTSLTPLVEDIDALKNDEIWRIIIYEQQVFFQSFSKAKYGIPVGIKHNAHEGEVGPLFWQHYSFMGLNPNGLKDQYANYWDVAVNHTKINIAHAEANPNNYQGYGKDKGWGLTASYSLSGYQAHHPDNDHGVISPTAALSSMPYAPDESLSFARYLFDHLEDKVWGEYGFYDAYSESEEWFPQRYLAIDQGPIVVMIENYRTGLIWDLFMQAPEIQEGLKKLGFESPHLK